MRYVILILIGNHIFVIMPYYRCFEQNLHNQISGGASVPNTTVCGNQVVDTTFFVP